MARISERNPASAPGDDFRLAVDVPGLEASPPPLFGRPPLSAPELIEVVFGKAMAKA